MSDDSSTGEVRLREVLETDLPVFVRFEMDEAAIQMAAFGSDGPRDEATLLAHWTRILKDGAVLAKSILWRGDVAGYVLRFQLFGKPSVAYWIGRPYWSKGIATLALREFLRQIPERPLYARVAKDNLGSRRVLEKCDFSVVGEEENFAQARGMKIAELILRLPGT